MRLRSLQALRAVMETGSMTEAARRLYRTQPQVSRLIAGLQAELGFRLFIRQGRRLIPTQEGVRFYDEVKRILAGLDDVSRIAEDIRLEKDVQLRILAQPYIAQSLIPGALARFSCRHPTARFSLEIRSRGDVGYWMAGKQFDIGIAALPIEVPAVRSSPFADVEVVAVLPAGHPLSPKAILSAEDLTHYPFIALNPFTLLRHRIDSLFAELGLRLNVRAETSSGLSTCQMAAKGLGITLADPLVALCIPSGEVVVRPWTPGLTLTYGFVFLTTHAPSALARGLAEDVAATAKMLQPKYVSLVTGALSAQVAGVPEEIEE